MKRRIILLLVILLLCNKTAYASSSAFAELPSWLTGKLCVNVLGTSSKNYHDRPVEQYIAVFDFGEKCINTVQIPMGSRLLKELYSNEIMIAIKNYKEYYWGMHQDAAFQLGFVSDKGVVDYREYDCEGYPMALLGYGHVYSEEHHSKKTDAFYIIIDDKTRKLQLVQESYKLGLDSRKVLIPDLGKINCRNHFLYPVYAISPDGKVAYSTPSDFEYSVGIIAGDSHIKLVIPDNLGIQSMCWLDNDVLLITPYLIGFADTHWSNGGTIQKYDFNTGKMGPISELWKGNDIIIEGYPRCMATNNNHNQLAVFVDNGGIVDPYYRIINLETGDFYDFSPYRRDEEMYSPYYAVSQSGVLFYCDDTIIIESIAWY